jgi:outer membrane protein assembly factor BamB
LDTGEPLWECAGMTANAIPSPIPGGPYVYLTSGFRGSALQALRLGRRGVLTGTDAVAWSVSKNTPYVPTPLLYEGRLYFCSGNNAILSILDARSGAVLVDAERLEGVLGVYASPVGADGRVYLVGRNGVTLVLREGPRLEVLARNSLDDGFDASPAAVGKELFLRGRKHLYCIAEP